MSHHHSHGIGVFDEARDLAKDLRSAIPDVYAGFAQMHKSALAGGALDAKSKELVALAISVTQQCDGCIASHARGAAMKGATAEEVAEMLGVCILMTGGPGTVYGPRAYAAFLEFREKYDRD